MAEGGFEKTSEERLKDVNASSDSEHKQELKDLELAVKNGDTSKVSELIKAGVDPNYGMFYAVQNNDESMVRLLIAAGADVNTNPMRDVIRKNNKEIAKLLSDEANATNNGGPAPLFDAVRNNNEAMVKVLIDAGADVNATSNALFYAVQNKNGSMVQLLIDAGAANENNVISRLLYHGPTPLFYAVRNNNEDMVKLLIEYGAGVNATSSLGFYAVENQDENSVLSLIKQENIITFCVRFGYFKTTEYEGPTSLFDAAENKNEAMVKILIDAGADVNAKENDGPTSLFPAVRNSSEPIVKLLIKSGADVNATSHDGQTTLFDAVQNMDEAIVKLLIESGADVNATSHGQTTLFDAVQNMDEAIVKLLLASGADVNVANHHGHTVLYNAVQNNDEAMVMLLINAGADAKGTSSELSYAVKNKNESMVRLLIDAGADVDAIGTGLFDAVQNKDEGMARLLIAAGADVNTTRYDGRTPLFDAVQNNNEHMVQLLVDAGADVNIVEKRRSNEGQIPLFYAVQNNNEPMVKLLLDAGADVNIVEKRGLNNRQTSLFCAVEHGSESMVRLLIGAGADINIVDNACFFSSKSVLDHYVQNNNECMVQLLIDAGADLNIVGDKVRGRTALFYAVTTNKIVLVHKLISNGADVNYTDEHGRTPLLASVCHKSSVNKVMVQELINAGADINATDEDGKTALFSAVHQRNIERVIRALIDKDVDVNITDKKSKAAVFSDVQRNNESVIRALIDSGADVNVTDKEGKSPLFEAVQSCDNELVVHALIDAGADVNCTDHNGRTPLFYSVCCKESTLPVCKTLIQAGADVNTSDKTGQTALFYAVQRNNEGVIRALIDAGADVNTSDNTDQTALFYVVGDRNLTLTSALIDAGVDVNVKDHGKQTALFRIITDVESLLEHGDKTEVLAKIEEGAESIPAGKWGIFNPVVRYGAHSTFNSVLQALLDAGADMNNSTIRGETALSKAVECGDFRTVSALIRAGADLEIKNFLGQTAIFGALKWCYRGDFRFLNELIAAGADVNTHDREGKTPLFNAVHNPGLYFTVVQRLIDAGADVNETDNEGQTALFYFAAGRWNRYSDIKEMVNGLISAGLDVNKVDKQGKTVLYWAAIEDNVELTQRFIKAGADANTCDYRGQTALSAAVNLLVYEYVSEGNKIGMIRFEGEPAATARMKIVRALVKDGNADVNARDIDGRTPLFYAVGRSRSIYIYLIEHGANLSIRDNCGVSALSLFIESCMVSNDGEVRVYPSLPCDTNEVLNLFLQHGITRNAVFEAIINVVFCKTLLVASYISDYREKNEIKSLFNILKVAGDYITETQNTKKKIIEDILTMVQDESRDFRKFYEFLVPDILSQLIELGANPNSTDAFGNTALHLASSLPLYGLSRETVMKICYQLETFGVIFNIRNHEKETPLLFCLSTLNHPFNCWQDDAAAKLSLLRDVFTYLMQHGSRADEKTSRGKSVFHILLDLVLENFRCIRKETLHVGGQEDKKRIKQEGVQKEQEEEEKENKVGKQEREEQQDEDIQEQVQLEEKKEQEKRVQIFLSLFDSKLYMDKDTINTRENHALDSPLHCWARLDSEISNIKIDKGTLRTILNHLLEHGASLNITNEKGETPLHVCSSWAAETMLLDAGADPCVSDSLGRQPLLVAAAHSAKYMPHFLERNRLYFDLLLEPHEFWRSAIERGLDPWAVDKRGESVLSVLIKSNQFVLSKALVEVARDDNHLQSESIATSLLNTICKDKSTHAHWKSNLAEIILMSVGGSVVMTNENETSALHHCCRNIVENFSEYSVTEEKAKDKEVYWTIAKLLLSYGGDCTIADSSGKSCLDIAKTKPALKNLLTKPQDIKEVPLLIPWTSISDTFEDKLTRVARRKESKHLEPYWYHKDHLASGSFGAVFAGINEKDGREVAIKRIEKIRMVRPEDKREITNLTALADCEQVVRYLSFFEDDIFYYVVLELMEGNLDDYLKGLGPYFRRDQGVDLCGNVINGLRYLHSQQILHRDLKPSNILYKCHPKLCLKIADFGLSRRIDNACTTVYGTNVGTRCWIAPEVLKSKKAGEQHSKESDVFSCGLVLHYMLSVKKHAFAPADLANKSEEEINHVTEDNILNGKMEGWDDSLCPEATHLIKAMLDGDESKRPSADKATKHPFFWQKEKKLELLNAVGNQKEFGFSRAKRTPPLTAVETDLEASFGTIVKYVDWNDPGYVHMPAIYTEMTTRRGYNTSSSVELVRFVRNAYAHVTALTTPIQDQLLKHYVFLEYFPNLVMEVYKAVTTHGWDQTRNEIKHAFKMNI